MKLTYPETSRGSSTFRFLALLPRFQLPLTRGGAAHVSLGLDFWADARLAPEIRDAAQSGDRWARIQHSGCYFGILRASTSRNVAWDAVDGTRASPSKRLTPVPARLPGSCHGSYALLLSLRREVRVSPLLPHSSSMQKSESHPWRQFLPLASGFSPENSGITRSLSGV